MDGGDNLVSVRTIEPAKNWVAVTVNTVLPTARAVYVGIAGDYDFSADGASTWVKFTGCAAGSIIPIAATAARANSGGGAPSTGAIVFLY